MGLAARLDSNNPFSRISFTNFPSTNEIENYGASLQTDYSVGAIDVTAIGAYRAVRSLTNADSDFTSADIIGQNLAVMAQLIPIRLNCGSLQILMASSTF